MAKWYYIIYIHIYVIYELYIFNYYITTGLHVQILIELQIQDSIASWINTRLVQILICMNMYKIYKWTSKLDCKTLEFI